ncbi:MAG: response regulator [Ignavibacteriales bacterium]|nr:response regulator [Ignavibacteriales bacterium]
MVYEDAIRVLVVEDELVAATYIRHKLHELGYNIVATLPTGEQALELLESDKPDIILMDIVLEGKLDGIDTANIVQEKYGIPVIFLTSYSDEQKINRALTSQPFGYILKPIQERELHANIRMCLYKSQLDKQLKKSELRSRAILQNSPLAIVTTNMDFVVDFANEKFTALFGLSTPQEIVGNNALDLLLPDSEAKRQFNAILLAQHKVSGFTARTPVKNASQLVLRISAGKFQAVHEGYEFFIEDQTEKEYYEHEAKKAEMKFKSIFNSPAYPFILMDSDYKIEIFNEAAYSLAQELSGICLTYGSPLETIYPDIIQELQAVLPQINIQENVSLDKCFTDTTGSSRWIELSFTKIAHADITHAEYSVTMKDITDRKEYEASLKDYITKLEQQQNKLEEQSVELYYLNEKLLYSEHDLKEMNANKDKFFSIIAHDLRSPFNNLLGFSEYLIEDFDLLDRETIRSIAGELNKSTKRVFELLENLLQWSRIQAKRTEYNPEIVQLPEIVQSILKLYGPVAAKKMVHIYPDVPDKVELFADKNMFSSLLQNLLSNAIKFTAKGGWVKLQYEETEDEHIIRVVDNGIGMPAEIISRLFKIEENVSRYGTEQEAGTGLGLILCKEFIEFHSGRLAVESEVGSGSRFTITLPRQDAV